MFGFMIDGESFFGGENYEVWIGLDWIEIK